MFLFFCKYPYVGSKNTCTSAKHVRARFIVSAHVYNLCARICAQIFIEFETVAHKIVINNHIIFYEDPSLCCGDICKTTLTFG